MSPTLELALVPGSTWDGATVVKVTRMPDTRLCLRRDGATSVLVHPDDALRAGVVA